MSRQSVKYMVFLLLQAAIWNYCNFSQFVTVVILPALIICLPVSRGTLRAMLLAFITGLAVDFFVSGRLGLTSFALVPVALLRRPVISLVFGSELFARGEELSFDRQGWQKFVPFVSLLTALFLLLYVWVDSAGTRPFLFNAVRFGASLLVSVPVSVFVSYLMLSENR